MSRKVTVVSTKTNVIKHYETEAATWGELITEIQGDFDLSNLKANENINKTTLEHIDAKLPEGPFRVFLRPVKTKAGAPDFSTMGFKEMREDFVKSYEDVKAFLLSKFNRNWTQVSKEELREGLTEFHASKATGEASVEEGATVTEVVAQEPILAVSTDGVLRNVLAQLRGVNLSDSVAFNSLNDDQSEEMEVHFDTAIESLEAVVAFFPNTGIGNVVESVAAAVAAPPVPATPVESEEDKAKRLAAEEEARLEEERKEAQRKEDEEILREAKDFQEGLI